MTKTTTACNDIHDRYAIDWELCAPVSTTRWAQIDTEADAAWFGQWVNPFRRIVLAYIEGELQVTRCDDDRELAAQLHRIADWHREHDRWKGIDPWNDELARRLEDAGTGRLMHAGRRPKRQPVHEGETSTTDTRGHARRRETAPDQPGRGEPQQ